MTEVQRLLNAFAEAHDTYTAAEERVQALGEEELARLETVYGEFQDLLVSYREPASGSGRETFQSYIELEGKLDDFVSSLPPDLLERDTLVTAADVLDKRRLTESDFDRAEAELSPVEDRLAVLSAREDALSEYRETRRNVNQALQDVEDRIDELHSILAFDSVDFDRSVSALESPITNYNQSVRRAFDRFTSETPVRDVLSFVTTTESFPLVPFRAPPDSLVSYFQESPVGEEPIPVILEYTAYSRSKLNHYVDDSGTFNATVTANQTYLDRLSPDPVAIEWPPPSADELTWRTTELIKVVGRFAPAETIALLHEINDLARDRERYSELRDIVIARDALSRNELEKLKSGAIESELGDAKSNRDQLSSALDTYPDR